MTLMRAECAEAPDRVADALRADLPLLTELGAVLRARPPSFAATVARGSSDHAATFAAQLLAQSAGLATASLPPSVVTRYGARLRLEGALVLALSQSGGSPDLVETLRAARAGGACTVAIVNAPGSPLAAAAEWVLPQGAGPERAVAATKSFVLTLLAVVRLLAAWTDDPALRAALPHLPGHLREALRAGWDVPLDAPHGLYVVARGPTLAVAQEAALKLKETSRLHAEAFSAAELRHGPRAVAVPGFPVLAFAGTDAGGDDTRALAAELAATGSPVLWAAHRPGPGTHLRLPPPLHPWLDPIVAILAFYPWAERLALSRGLDPDRPAGLSKVTETV